MTDAGEPRQEPWGLCIDIGKSGARGRLTGPGLDVIAPADGIEPEATGRPGAGARLLSVVDSVWGRLESQIGSNHRVDLGTLVVGSTSVPAPAEVEEFLDGAKAGWPHARIALAEDGILGHAAALGGPGNYVSVGTGVIVYGLDRRGGWHRKDGWGPDLGDRGSAVWLGSAGLASAFRAADGVDPETELLARAHEYLGGMDHAAAVRLASRVDRVATVAGFARIVCSIAKSDPVARELVAQAAAKVCETTKAMTRETAIDEVAVGGRLAYEPEFLAALDSSLTTAGLRRAPGAVEPWMAPPSVMFTPAYAPACTGIRL